MNFRLPLITFCIFAILNLSYLSYAATVVSQTSGNWSLAATWGGVVPANNDDVIIASGTIVNLNSSLPISSSLLSLTIQPGSTLIVTVNSSTLRIKGNLTNDGVLSLWQTNNLQADIFLYGNSNWSGTGSWNLSSVNIQTYSLETSSALFLTINGSLFANAGGSFNKINKHQNITVNFQGTVNSTLPSLKSDFYYGHIILNKNSGNVSFTNSIADNNINFIGKLILTNVIDRLYIGDFNTLTIHNSVTGLGDIGGGITCSLIVDSVSSSAINPLRIFTNTVFKNFVVNRTAGVVLADGFTIRDSLILNNYSRLTLSNQTLVIGINGATPTKGIFYGNGSLVGSTNAKISIRGNNPNPTQLRFAQLTASEYTLDNFIIDKISGGSTGLLDGSSLIVRGFLDVYNNNQYEIGNSTLTLTSVPHFYGDGSLKGSTQSILTIAGTGSTSYSLPFDQSTPIGHTLKSYTQSRKATITLLKNLNVIDLVSLTGNNSILASDGNLTLISSATTNAAIGPLLNGANVTGNVNVQVHLTGDNFSMYLRGYRSLSTPINDPLIFSGNKKSFEQLKESIILTGPGGVANGFDQGGIAQPFAETLTYYNEAADVGQPSFIPVNNITETLAPGIGFYAFFRGLQMGSYLQNYNKLNAPYLAPGPVTAIFKGVINKFDVPVILVRSNHINDNFNGYNLIGNPFPSAIDWTKVSRSAGVNDEIIIIKPGGGQATYINGISSNGGSQYIQTGQGFYVRDIFGGSTIMFKENCKTSSYPARLLFSPGQLSLSSSYNKDNLSSNCDVLKLNIYDGFDQEETTIAFRPNEKEFANYNDAMYFSGGSVKLCSFSADKKLLAINFMPDVDKVKEIKLYVSADKNGSYNLKFTEIPSFSGSVYLKDYLKPGELIQIKKNLSYSFVINKNDPATYGSARFLLLFKLKEKEDKLVYKPDPDKLLTAFPNPVNNEVTFNTEAFSNKNIRLIISNMYGKIIKTSKFLMNEKATVSVLDLKPGVYVAKFRAEDNGRILAKTKFLKL